MGLALAALGWLARTVITRQPHVKRTKFDVPLWLFFCWTVMSAIASAEPRVSLLKLGSVATFLVFYLTQAVVTRRTATWLVWLMIVSGAAGALWSIGEVARGRGIMIEEMASDSPFRGVQLPALLQPGDCIWRVSGRRVRSITEIDEAIKRAPAGARLPISVITQGEHVEWLGPVVTAEMKLRPAPSRLSGTHSTHRFRASGWTRHYATFAEVLQMLAQLALGFALANFRRIGWQQSTRDVWRAAPQQQQQQRTAMMLISAMVFVVLAVGIALTAMRTVLVAFAIGVGVIVWRAAHGRTRLAILLVVACILTFGMLTVWRTRASGALLLQDASAHLRWQVAQVALQRVPLHPLLGHGMDALKYHWTEWDFPGTERIHMHSSPLQIAFERGLPALLLWLWIIALFWATAARAEAAWRSSADVNRHGFLLGATGAAAGFAASSLVNYNFGDAEAVLLLWWLMGAVVKVASSDDEESASQSVPDDSSGDYLGNRLSNRQAQRNQ